MLLDVARYLNMVAIDAAIYDVIMGYYLAEKADIAIFSSDITIFSYLCDIMQRECRNENRMI